MIYRELIEAEFQLFHMQLQSKQADALAAYCTEVHRWNQKVNLTSLSGSALARRLVVEPTWIAGQLSLKGALIDVGSGNGSPALPFCIVSDLQSCHLVEARTKRAAFLRHMVAALGLKNVSVHRAKYEVIAPTLPIPDWISLQAVALDRALADAFRRVASPTTTILWITSGDTKPALNPIQMLTVPITNTRVFLFQLDLS